MCWSTNGNSQSAQLVLSSLVWGSVKGTGCSWIQLLLPVGAGCEEDSDACLRGCCCQGAQTRSRLRAGGKDPGTWLPQQLPAERENVHLHRQRGCKARCISLRRAAGNDRRAQRLQGEHRARGQAQSLEIELLSTAHHRTPYLLQKFLFHTLPQLPCDLPIGFRRASFAFTLGNSLGQTSIYHIVFLLQSLKILLFLLHVPQKTASLPSAHLYTLQAFHGEPKIQFISF